MNDKRFYIYEWFKTVNNEIFYVGKGTGRRRFDIHNRGKYFMNVFNKYECDVRVYKDNLTNEESCEWEIKRIAELKSIGQAYCNFTNGGTGFSTGKLNPTYKTSHKGKSNQFYGKHHSKETKMKISDNRKGKGGQKGELNSMYGSDKTKGERNGMYGKKAFEHPNSKMYEFTINEITEILTYKQCEKKFGIAFNRIYEHGGKLHYKKRTPNSIYEGLEIIRIK